MQFPFKISEFLPVDESNICLLNGKTLKGNFMVNTMNARYGGYRISPLGTIINTMGKLSSKAQRLKTIITTFGKFANSEQRLYIKMEDEKVVGILKIGEKNLFYRTLVGSIKEIKATCVLDFYIHESCQRKGFGKELFKKMLYYEHMKPRKFAYDRPSSKLIGFLRKHYGLKNYVPQNNNYVIFNEYFHNMYSLKPKRKTLQPIKKSNNLPSERTNFNAYTNNSISKRSYGSNKVLLHINAPWYQESENGFSRRRLLKKRPIGHKKQEYLEALESKIRKAEQEINQVKNRLESNLPFIPQRHVQSLYSKKGYSTTKIDQNDTGGLHWATHGYGGYKNAELTSHKYGSHAHYFFKKNRDQRL